MLRPLASAATVGIVAALALAGCTTERPDPGPAPKATTTYDPALAKFYTQQLSWTNCGDDGQQCSKLTVPVDYTKPAGDTIQLSVLRVVSVSKKTKGSLIINPGGPGGSGVDYARYAAQGGVFSGPLMRAYNVVGFDPRGVGDSAPVWCEDGPQFDAFLSTDPTPDDAAEQQKILDADKQFGAGCLARNPKTLAHVSTEDAARDIDVLRAALGDNTLHYFGASYGTFLGATYADLFPKNVGRMVLDGAMDPKLTGEQSAEGQAGGFETAFNSYAKACVDDGGCPLGSSLPEAQKTVQAFLKRLDSKPLGAGGEGPKTGLDEAWASYGIAAALYDEGSWNQLTEAFRQAFKGDGQGLMELAMAYTQRKADGSYSGNMLQAISAVSCLDRPASADVAHYAELQTEYAKRWPTFGPFMAWSGLICGTWPVKATGHAHAITAPGAPPIVVVGTTRDPATPYAQAVSLANQLSSGRLITRDGDGHTGYNKGNACVDKAVDKYLIDGVAPDKDTRC